MLSSIFKSFAVSAFLSASRASAAIKNWDITTPQIVTDFSNESTNEITLTYEIGTGHTSYNVDLFDKGCSNQITGTTINKTSSTTPKDTNHVTLEVLLDVDKLTIASSNSTIWSGISSKIEMCVRVQLLSGATVIAEDSRDIDVGFTFNVEFTTLAEANFNTAALSSGSDTATVENYVEACTCDDASSFTCITDAVVPSSVLNICVKSLSADMNINYINSLVVTQGSKVLNLYDGGDIQNVDITSETKVPTNNGVLVASRIPSEFFSYSGTSTATVTGMVYLQLPGSMRRLAVEITGYPKVQATGSTRALNKRFGAQTASSPFVIDLQLEKKELGAAIDANAANIQSVFLVVMFVAPIIAMML